MYTFNKLPNGNVEILKDGSRVTTSTPEYAKQFGYTEGMATPSTTPATTQAPAAPLPTLETPTATTPQTPAIQPTGNTLLDFKNSLDYATNLARQKRASLSLDFMKPFSGIVAASDFGSILSNLNQASDSYSSDLLKNATTAMPSAGKYELRDIGGDLYQIQTDANGQVIGKPTLIKGGVKKPTESDIQSSQAKSTSKVLLDARGPDGYTDPNLYAQERVNSRMSPTEFDNRFGYLVNPQSKDRLGLGTTAKSGLTGDQLSIINDAKARLDAAKQRYEDVPSIRSAIIETSKAQYGFDPSPFI